MRHPLLEKVLEADNPTQFYALTGLAFAFANEIEDSLFWAYWQTSGQSRADAAKDFYDKVNFSLKQDKVDAVVKAGLRDREADKRAWFELIRRIQGELGHGSTRNLLGHNAVSYGFFHSAERVGKAIALDMEIRPLVTQKRDMVEHRGRKDETVGNEELTVYCQRLMDLFVDLEHFLAGPLQLDPKSPERYSRVVSGG